MAYFWDDNAELREEAAKERAKFPGYGNRRHPHSGPANPWREPHPQLPWPELDPAAFYGLAGDVVRLAEPFSEGDPAAILVQFLAAVGSAFGRGAYLQVGKTKHYPHLFAVICGDSAKARKGTSWSHVESLLHDADPEWSDHCIKSGLVSGEGLIHAAHDEIWVREKVPQGGKGKPPKYEWVLKEEAVQDKRLLVIEQEFANLLAVMERPGNTLSPLLRLAWDGARLQTISKHYGETASDAHISLIGHITLDEVRRQLDQVSLANGFGNRFLFVLARRSKELPRPIDNNHATGLAGNLSEHVLRNRLLRREITFNPLAGEQWDAAYHELSAAHPGLFGAIVARCEPQVLRLAMIYALLDQTYHIHPPHLSAALAMWKYCHASARYIFGDLIGDSLADAILSALRQPGCEGLTRTQISEIFGRNQSASRIAAALALLLQQGKAKPVQPRGFGQAQIWAAV